MDDERLKQGTTTFGRDYFRELLERVRSIRANERRIWQQITDIFAECSIDYDREAPETRRFYAMVQNKFHYAITGKTAAEIIYHSADHNKEHMGLRTWKNAPDGRILKSDVTVTKNYLDEKETHRPERVVSGYFDNIEDLIERENTFNMAEFTDGAKRGAMRAASNRFASHAILLLMFLSSLVALVYNLRCLYLYHKHLPHTK